MRRYTIRVNETEHVLDVEEIGSDTFTVHLSGGRLVDVRLVDHQDLAQATVPAGVALGPVRAAGTVRPRAEEPGASARPTPPAAGRSRDGGRGSVTAPMPGVVLSVEVEPGRAVTRGQTLVVLEAMKMKNDLKAERDGIVAKVHVRAGDQVRHGDPLVEFEG